jgi:uncharacterized membrane protein
MARRILKAIQARARLLVAVLVGCGVGVVLSTPSAYARAVIAWDAGVICYLVSAFAMMARSDAKALGRRALREDDGALAVLALTVAAAVVSLVALVAELSSNKAASGVAGAKLVLALATLLLSWSFVHTIFALHYAHEYELGQSAQPDAPGPIAGGLDFQDPERPDYFDFVYFSFVIGIAAQTADVVITRKPMRRLATVHCIVSFLFNATILALAINLAAAAF